MSLIEKGTDPESVINSIPAPSNPETQRVGSIDKTVSEGVFRETQDGVNFRSVGWIQASVIFIKLQFALGVLSIPSAMYTLGAVGGAFNVIGWGVLNTYWAYTFGLFRAKYPQCHNIADMAFVCGGQVARVFTEFLFVLTYVLSAGAGIVGVTIGINALSDHAACTIWWTLLSTVVVVACASIRKFEKLSWLTWVGFASIFTAVFIVVIAVTIQSRPAAAPPTGPYELGFHAMAYPDFVSGISAVATIFVASSATSAMVPVISEMRRPEDYNKALFTCQSFINSCYLTFSLVVYAWCGQWVASPSLGSAGGVIKKVAYGVGLLGLMVSGCLWLHVAAKILFVRILRNSRHLQSNTIIHWGTWLGCTVGLGSISFILAEAIPIFNYIVALSGSLCFAPMALCYPAWFWLYCHTDYLQKSLVYKALFIFHAFLGLIGAFITVGGTYGTVQLIVDAYAANGPGSAFSCADNSGSS